MKISYKFLGFVAALVLLFSTNSSAQMFTNYTTTDGLVSNNVLCVATDTANNIWFGTQNGISKFDGTTWTTYNQTSHPNLINNNINTIFVASDNRVWVGTDFGASVFNGTSFTSYTTTDGLGNNRVNNINEDVNGVIWFGEFSGATKYDGTTFTAYGTAQGLPFGGILHIEFDSNNDVWMGSGLGGLVKYDGTSFTTISTPQGLLHNVVRSLVIDAQDNKWVGTAAGVSVVDAAGTVTAGHTRMLILPAPDTLNPVEDIDMDSQGRIWSGIYVDYLVTEGGVAMYDGSQWLDYDVSDGLVGPVVRQLVVDKNDDVWVATSSGISKISNVPNAIQDIAQNAPSFEIYPNPATDYLMINFDDNYSETADRQIAIYTLGGQEVATFLVNGLENKVHIPLENLEAGMYFIRVNHVMSKFVLNR